MPRRAAQHVTLLPDTQQALMVLINANTEVPFDEVNAVMSGLPIGVVNVLRGQPVPQAVHAMLRSRRGRHNDETP